MLLVRLGDIDDAVKREKLSQTLAQFIARRFSGDYRSYAEWVVARGASIRNVYDSSVGGVSICDQLVRLHDISSESACASVGDREFVSLFIDQCALAEAERIGVFGHCRSDVAVDAAIQSAAGDVPTLVLGRYPHFKWHGGYGIEIALPWWDMSRAPWDLLGSGRDVHWVLVGMMLEREDGIVQPIQLRLWWDPDSGRWIVDALLVVHKMDNFGVVAIPY